MNIKTVLFSIAVASMSFSSYATMVTSNGLCDTSSVQITSIETNPGGDSVTGMTYPIDSTKCLGYITAPANDWGNSPNPNNGLLGEGLLNGEVNKDGYFIPGGYFLTNPNDSMVDLDNNGSFTDPGWIRLGGVDDIGDNDVNLTFEPDSIGNYNIGSVINMQFSMNGTWSLAVDPAAIPFATNALGRPTVFDHLAFVMKGPNPNGGKTSAAGWAVYDFNFWDLIDSGLNISLGDTAYSFEGTWDSSTIFGGQRLSHFSVWAHDPPGALTVDEPALFGLMGMGLMLIGLRRKSRRA